LTDKRNGYACLAGYMPSRKHLTTKPYDYLYIGGEGGSPEGKSLGEYAWQMWARYMYAMRK